MPDPKPAYHSPNIPSPTTLAPRHCTIHPPPSPPCSQPPAPRPTLSAPQQRHVDHGEHIVGLGAHKGGEVGGAAQVGDVGGGAHVVGGSVPVVQHACGAACAAAAAAATGQRRWTARGGSGRRAGGSVACSVFHLAPLYPPSSTHAQESSAGRQSVCLGACLTEGTTTHPSTPTLPVHALRHTTKRNALTLAEVLLQLGDTAVLPQHAPTLPELQRGQHLHAQRVAQLRRLLAVGLWGGGGDGGTGGGDGGRVAGGSGEGVMGQRRQWQQVSGSGKCPSR